MSSENGRNVPNSDPGEHTVPWTVAGESSPDLVQHLSQYSTLRLGGPARRFIVADTTDSLVHTIRELDAVGEPVLLVGGGSNLVVSDSGFAGTVVHIATTGADGGTVAAGEDWDAYVAATVSAGLGGLECLSGIPGSAGATPIQNVGAYGAELSDVVESIEFYDRRSREVRTVTARELGFGYRTSILKGTDVGVVLSVRFRLYEDGLSAPVRYAELARALDVPTGSRVPVAEAREAVLGLRHGKGMVLNPGDHDTWSAGSFFTNPIVPAADSAAVLAGIGEVVGPEVTVPWHRVETGVKLSAAWLIEHAGFTKGYSGPGERVALSTKHTLALTNRGGASTDDLLALAREIRHGVWDRFGVALYPEPLLINCCL